MFEIERPALETDKERSTRHARMVAAAVAGTLIVAVGMTLTTAALMLVGITPFSLRSLIVAPLVSGGIWIAYMIYWGWKNW
jgi:hypothetical protein